MTSENPKTWKRILILKTAMCGRICRQLADRSVLFPSNPAVHAWPAGFECGARESRNMEYCIAETNLSRFRHSINKTPPLTGLTDVHRGQPSTTAPPCVQEDCSSASQWSREKRTQTSSIEESQCCIKVSIGWIMSCRVFNKSSRPTILLFYGWTFDRKQRSKELLTSRWCRRSI